MLLKDCQEFLANYNIHKTKQEIFHEWEKRMLLLGRDIGNTYMCNDNNEMELNNDINMDNSNSNSDNNNHNNNNNSNKCDSSNVNSNKKENKDKYNKCINCNEFEVNDFVGEWTMKEQAAFYAFYDRTSYSLFDNPADNDILLQDFDQFLAKFNIEKQNKILHMNGKKGWGIWYNVGIIVIQ